jgi:hypothetical protein
MSCRRNFSIYRKEEVLCQLKIRDAIEKFKNQPRPLLRPRYVNFSQHFWNQSRKTVPLNREKFATRVKTMCCHILTRQNCAVRFENIPSSGLRTYATKKIKTHPSHPAMTRVQFLFTLVFPSQQIGTNRRIRWYLAFMRTEINQASSLLQEAYC